MIQAISSVIANQGRFIFGIVLFIIFCSILTFMVLRNIFDDQLTSTEYLSLAVAGWILPASLISMLWFLFGSKLSAPSNLLILSSLFIILIFFLLRFKPYIKPDSKSTIFFLLLFFFISLLLRLVLISKAILPSYFDSASHYTEIKNILGNNTTGLITSLTSNYYHLGFHFIAAFMAAIFHANIANAMLIIGQMALAVMPISFFFLIKHETGSNGAGLFAVIISAFGWYMPAHAVDWGKYPALTSVGLIPFVLSLAYLLSKHKSTLSLQKRWMLYSLLAIGILVSGFVHSRSLVIFGIAFTAWIIATWQQKLPIWQRGILFIIVVAAIILEIIYIQNQDVLGLLFDPYVPKGILITALVLFLSIFALRSSLRVVFTCLLAVSFLLGSLFIPVLGLIPGHENLTLLDRPFVELILFLPLSVIGGLGLAGLEKFLQAKNIKVISSNGFVSLIACGLVLINAYATYEFYPATCCVLASQDDVTAIDWIANHIPANAHIGISATELKVLTSGTFEGYVGGDAGIWITPLSNKFTTPLLYDTDFSEQATFDNLCRSGISYLYVGDLGQNFDDSQLRAKPTWYKALLFMPEVRVYQVIGCK
jgi:hypothetical protein